jgi:hypothetical protein
MIELGLALLFLAIVIGAFIILRSIKYFLMNTLVGLIILFLANAVGGLGIGYSWVVVLICALGGALGAVLVIILHLLRLAF